jgi:guanylate kinase
MATGNLFIVMAPSGAGKTSLVQALVENEGSDRLVVSISHTTREIRPGEEEGVDYHFVDMATFEEMLEQGAFIESAEVYGHHYGTSQSWVADRLHAGQDVILEIDWQGAAQIRHAMPEAHTIFILPPSLESLRERLTKRAQDDVDTIERRMQQAVDEISHVAEADYVVVNGDFDKALADLQAIIHVHRLALAYQESHLRELLDKLTHSPE